MLTLHWLLLNHPDNLELSMKIKTILGSCVVFYLAACGGTPDPEAEKEKFLKASGKAVNVEFNNKKQAEAVLGFRATSVNAGPSLKHAGGSGSSQQGSSENVKAACKLKGDGYTAVFETPAMVNMPSFGRSMEPVEVTCTYKDKEFSETFEAINLSSSSRDGTAMAVGVVLCPICGVAVAVANGGDKVGDVFGFDEINVNVH